MTLLRCGCSTAKNKAFIVAKPPDVMTLTCASDADGKTRSEATTKTDLTGAL
jgi:type IV pilus biogenesis protein CpaD/CtpE